MKLEFLTAPMRLPLKFGAETIEGIAIAHVELTAYGAVGRGETPLSAAWAWPSELSYARREMVMCDFCRLLAESWTESAADPLSAGWLFQTERLPRLLADFNRDSGVEMPYLAALICVSAFDIAMHDAFGIANGLPVYWTYRREFMEHDLSWFFGDSRFSGRYPADYFVPAVPETLPVWHLVGGRDLLLESERSGREPEDGYPVSLEGWIRRDGLRCLKIKLTGVDENWDYQRLVQVGRLALRHDCRALSADFNCQVRAPGSVNRILDRLWLEEPSIFDHLLSVEQPFPYDLEANRIDVHTCAERKPLFLDESAQDWRLVKLGRELGWDGVALKVCKTQTGALLSGCWAKEHGMKLMVQDLTNPMLAVIPHVLLAAYFGTICGVECNAPQFYPAISLRHEKHHPGLYERRNGEIVLSSIAGNGFGYGVNMEK